ncbi:MAG TPA: sodium:proton antiporter [Lachnospiraceae bacterium]|nr:sodium:proton antiporter [Lachnospiraceae bacterium]
MKLFIIILALFLIVCAIATCLHRTLLTSIIIFMAYSTIMSIIWALLESPDLAITEAAVGAGVTSILFFVTLKKIRAVETTEIRAGSAEESAAMAEGIGAENE